MTEPCGNGLYVHAAWFTKKANGPLKRSQVSRQDMAVWWCTWLLVAYLRNLLYFLADSLLCVTLFSFTFIIRGAWVVRAGPMVCA